MAPFGKAPHGPPAPSTHRPQRRGPGARGEWRLFLLREALGLPRAVSMGPGSLWSVSLPNSWLLGSRACTLKAQLGQLQPPRAHSPQGASQRTPRRRGRGPREPRCRPRARPAGHGDVATFPSGPPAAQASELAWNPRQPRLWHGDSHDRGCTAPCGSPKVPPGELVPGRLLGEGRDSLMFASSPPTQPALHGSVRPGPCAPRGPQVTVHPREHGLAGLLRHDSPWVLEQNQPRVC